jgi:biofilm PGA synthesis N-glycosyltransferase PgaC
MTYVALFPSVAALSWIVLGLLFVVRREWRLPLDPGFRPSVAVVVPAHDEALLIERAIRALLAQDHPIDLHVVSDGSTDQTVAIARRYEAQGVTVHELTSNAGKSAALQHVLDRVQSDLFVVVDADTVCAPDAVRHLVQQFADPRVGAVTGHARVGNVCSPLTAMQAMEYSVIVGLAKRAEQFWGGLYTVSGAAACFRASALRGVGGWSVATATEDIEVSWRLQRAGWLLAYDPRALFFIQAPVALRALYRQRRRWARGMVEVLRLHWNIAGTHNRALIPIAIQVLCAGAWMLFATAVLAYSAAAALAGSGDTAALAAFVGADWHVLFVWSFVLFGCQAFVACVFDGAYIARGWPAFPLFLLFPVYFWVVIYPSFLLGAARGAVTPGSPRWERTERVPVAQG